MQPPKKTTPLKDALRTKAGVAIGAQTAIKLDQRAIDDGRKPLVPRRKDTAAIQAKAIEMYGVPAGGLAAIAPIESSFKFSPVESDGEHHFLHVESLLEQAGRLLERCAAERSQRNLLHRERWQFQLELDEFLRLDGVRERERQAGAATLAYERSAIEGAVEGGLAENLRSSEAQLKEFLGELVATGFDRRMAARELSAWLSGYPLKDKELTGDDATYSFDGITKSKPEHLFDTARSEADEAAWEQVYSIMSRRYALAAASEAARLRKESLDRQAKWSLADIGSRGEREQAARDEFWEKVYQAQAPDGLFHYNQRIAASEARFTADFREAMARLGAARRGLKDVYGYAPEFPKEGTAGYFDDVVQWVRTASSRLAQFAQQDQNYVLAVSLKDLTKSQWEAGLATPEWTFEVPEDLFPGQAHVRLRGLGVAVMVQPAEAPPAAAAQKPKPGTAPPEAPTPEGYWTARVSVPSAGTVRHLSNEAVELDQKALPLCFLGRVTDWDSPREPETVGASVLHNASPIGKQWKLTLSPKSTGGTPAAKLQDVQIYLHVAVRSRNA